MCDKSLQGGCFGFWVELWWGCVLLLYFLDKRFFVRRFSYSLLFGGLLTIIITIVVAVSSVKFDYLFRQFHLVFFPQGNWMFPSDYSLIMLFPKSFFFDGFVVVLLFSLIQGFVLLLLSSWYVTKNHKEILNLYQKKQKIFK